MTQREATLFERLCDLDTLNRAIDRTVSGKRGSRAVARFLVDRSLHLAHLARALTAETWSPTELSLLRLRDPKPRVIAVAPVADRVVATAVTDLLMAEFERTLAPSDFGCRPEFGTHRAILRLKALMRRLPFVVHLDVRAYFPSIDPALLLGLVRRRVSDERLMRVVSALVAQGAPLYALPEVRRHAGLTPDWPPPGRGLPIGSALSQFLAAHVYLNALDHTIVRYWHASGYVRYVDDLFVFGRSAPEVLALQKEIAAWLASHRGLRLKHPNAPVIDTRQTLDALGYRVRREGVSARRRTVKRLEQRVRAVIQGRARVDVARVIASYAGAICF